MRLTFQEIPFGPGPLYCHLLGIILQLPHFNLDQFPFLFCICLSALLDMGSCQHSLSCVWVPNYVFHPQQAFSLPYLLYLSLIWGLSLPFLQQCCKCASLLPCTLSLQSPSSQMGMAVRSNVEPKCLVASRDSEPLPERYVDFSLPSFSILVDEGLESP